MSEVELVVTPEDLHEAGYQTDNLAACPFCGRHYPLSFTRYNGDTGIYRVTVACTNQVKCGATIGDSSRGTPTEARAGAFAKWNRRAAPADLPAEEKQDG